MDDIVQGSVLRADPASRADNDGDPIHKVGIVGAGQMGSGIAHVIALSGYDVALHDEAEVNEVTRIWAHTVATHDAQPVSFGATETD